MNKSGAQAKANVSRVNKFENYNIHMKKHSMMSKITYMNNEHNSNTILENKRCSISRQAIYYNSRDQTNED